MKNTLSEYAGIYSVIADTTGAPTATGIDGTPIDMSGYDGVLFIARLDTIPTGVTTGWARLYPMVGSSSGSVASCTGSGEYAYTTALSTEHDNMSLVLDVKNPAERWIGCHLYKDSTNSFRGDVLAVAYGAAYVPITQPSAEVIHNVITVTPTT